MHFCDAGRVRERLAHISTQSERHFLALAEGFPQIMSELKTDLGAARSVLRLIPSYETGEAQGGTGASVLWDDVESGLQDSMVFFRGLSEGDTDVFETLKDGIRRLDYLRETIGGLREDALDIGVLAINATVTARKAGEKGRGFAYIAMELQRLASETVSDTDRLSSIGEQALDSLRSFQQVIETIESFQQSFFGEFEQRLREGLSALADVLRNLASWLSEIVAKAAGVERPLRTIMAEIQMQDIIVQSLAHVRLVVERSRSDGVIVTDDGTRASMATLCVQLLGDVRKKLGDSLGVFRDNVGSLRAILDEVHRDLGDDSAGTAGASPEAPGTFGRSYQSGFDRPLAILREIAVGIDTTIENRLALRDSGRTITRQMAEVLEHLGRLGKSVDKLYPLQVASKIHVAKEGELSGHLHAVEGIEEFVSKVDSHLGGSATDLTSGINRVEAVINAYSRSMESVVHGSRESAQEIRSLTTRLAQVQTALQEQLQNFSVFSDRFLALVDQAEREIDGLLALNSEIDELLSDLTEAMPRQDSLSLEEGDRKKVEEIVDSLLKRFTIARHKTSAASVAGMTVDSGDNEGELTLF